MTTRPPSLTVIHGGALGDLVLTLQLARAAVGYTPTATLRVIARVTLDGLAGAAPSICWRNSDAAGVHWLYGDGQGPAPAQLAEWVTGADVLWMLGDATDAAARRLNALGAARTWCVDPTPAAMTPTHIVTQWREQLILQDPGWADVALAADVPWPVVAELRTRGRALLGGDDVVVLHPGSGGRPKCWSLTQFHAVAAALRQQGRRVVFIAGPVEHETWSADAFEFLATVAPVLPLPSRTELCAVLAAAAGYIGNDAGPTHLAAALGTRTVVVFGPTAAEVWRPLGPRVVVLHGTLTMEADWGVTVAAVLAALAEAQ